MMEHQGSQMLVVSRYARRFVSKAAAALMCSGGLAWAIYRLMLQDAAQGREAYVAAQVAYFEETLSPPQAGVAILYVVMICVFLLLYEVISWGIYVLIKERRG